MNGVRTTALGCFYSYMNPVGRKRSLQASCSPGPWYSMGWYLSAWHWMATHTHFSFNLYDLHVTRRAQRPQCCLSEMAPEWLPVSRDSFDQQVLFGPLILSEMWVIGSKSTICFERRRKLSRGYINCICRETKARREEMQLCYIICSSVLYCSHSEARQLISHNKVFSHSVIYL